MNTLTIGKVAKKAQVSQDTIRLYERLGLIDEPLRAANGYRQFPNATVSRLLFITRSKELGFTLKEIKELLSIRQTSTNTCNEVRTQAEAKLLDIQQKVADLNRLQKALTSLIENCEQQTIKDDCPILAALEQPVNKRGKK